MLVLLIIFMVTAPMIQRGIDVKLPVARARGADRRRARLRHAFPSPTASRSIVYLGEEPIRAEVLQERVRQKMETRRRQGGLSCAATAACSTRN